MKKKRVRLFLKNLTACGHASLSDVAFRPNLEKSIWLQKTSSCSFYTTLKYSMTSSVPGIPGEYVQDTHGLKQTVASLLGLHGYK